MVISQIYEKYWRSDVLIEVVIPSYNRVDNLAFLIEHLLKSNNSHFCISIINNDPHNDLPTEYIESKNINKIPIRIFKNNFHLGPDASVLRALEIAQSDWIYLLGDSKIPTDNAFDIMVNDIYKHPDVASIVYKFKNLNSEPRSISHIKEISSNDLHWGDLFLGGNSILSAESVKSYFSIATQFTLTRSMLLIFHILALKDSKKVLIAKDRIIKEFIEKPDFYNPGLSLIECWAQFPLLVNLPISSNEKKILINKIISGEDSEDKIVFYKFCLIKIFRENIDLSLSLKNILAYRYNHNIISFEKIIITFLYYISKINYYITGSSYDQ